MTELQPEDRLWEITRGALRTRALAIVARGTGALEASGQPSFPAEFGTGFWAWLADHADERALFDRAMEQGNDWRVDRLAGLGWEGAETVVDVGGGNGSLLAGLLDRRPRLRGIVFDLPETTRDEANDEHWAKWLDLLVLALFAGRERDEAEWRTLLDAAGLVPLRIADGLIEARCP